jgi:hypothetical protein
VPGSVSDFDPDVDPEVDPDSMVSSVTVRPLLGFSSKALGWTGRAWVHGSGAGFPYV